MLQTPILSGQITRPADTTAYASGDLIANDVDAGDVVPTAFLGPYQGVLRHLGIHKSKTTGTLTVRAYIFDGDTAPAAGAGDNAAFTPPLVNCRGYIDVTVDETGSDGMMGWGAPDPEKLPEITFNGPFWILLKATAAYTPASGEVIRLFPGILKE